MTSIREALKRTPSRRTVLEALGVAASGTALAVVLRRRGGSSDGTSASTTQKNSAASTALPTAPSIPHNEQTAQGGFENSPSLNFPMHIDIPSGATATSTQENGRKIDIISIDPNTNATVLTEPVRSGISVDEYARNLLNQMKPLDPSAAMVDENSANKVRDGHKAHVNIPDFYRIPFVFYGDYDAVEALAHLSKTEVAGQKIRLLGSQIALHDTAQIRLNAVIFNRQNAYVVGYNFSLKNSDHGGEEGTVKDIQQFQKMLESIKFN